MPPDQAKRPAEKVLKLPARVPSLRVKPTFMQKSKYRHLLKDPNVYRWFRKLLRRSPVSAGEHIRLPNDRECGETQRPIVLLLLRFIGKCGVLDGQRQKKVFARKMPSFDAFEEEPVLKAVRETGRRNLALSGLWTSMCFAYTALHGLREGFNVCGLIDAGGDASLDAHRYGVQRMLHADVVPITWMPLVSEWMHDWANPKADELREEVYGRLDAVLGM